MPVSVRSTPFTHPLTGKHWAGFTGEQWSFEICTLLHSNSPMDVSDGGIGSSVAFFGFVLSTFPECLLYWERERNKEH